MEAVAPNRGARRSDGDRVAADRNRVAEMVVRRAIGCREGGGRAPRRAGPGEDIGRSLVAVGPDRGLVRPNHDHIAADRNREPEQVAAFAVGRGEFVGRGPSGARSREDVGRPLIVVGGSNHGAGRSNDYRIAADRNRGTKSVRRRTA